MEDLKKEQLPVPVLPARGARAGVRSDVNRAKEGSYNPVGTGSAWSHNFLNQKPWHPLNFRNQIKKYEHEQKAIQDFKAKEAAMAEWQAEQERQATLAFLSPEEAKKQRDRASIQFMYQKPPGLEAALARDRELADKEQREQAAAAAAAAGDGSQQQLQPSSTAAPSAAAAVDQAQQREQQQEALRQRQQQLDRLREDPFAAILAARSALQKSEKFVMKTVEGAFGGVAPGSENQLLLGDGEEEEQQQGAGEIDEAEALLASLDPEERQAVLAALAKKKRKAEKEARLEQAQELLRAAGIDPSAAAAAEAGGSSRSHKRHRKESSKHSKRRKESSSKHKKHRKQKKSHKERSRRGSDSDSSSGSGSDSDRR